MNDRSLEIFKNICGIPHPSGHEKKLREYLSGIAAKSGMSVRSDAAGNLRIDRKAAPGFEGRPLIIMQAHLDMVPQKDGNVEFDFEKEPITTIEEGGFLRSARGTTLGADNGAGLAAAMSILLDEELKTGPLAALFTVDEEVGLSGAAALSMEMLQGDILYNLDSDCEGVFYVGCAGGIRLRSDIELEVGPPRLSCGVKIQVGGLKGGHSGTDIDKPRGNAIIIAALLARDFAFELADFSGGKQDNAIPREAVLYGATTQECFEKMRDTAEKKTVELAAALDCNENFAVSVIAAPLPCLTASIDRSHTILNSIAKVSNAVESFDDELKIVHTSSNLAAVSVIDGHTLHICSSQRSLTEAARNAMTEELIRHFAAAGASSRTDNAYPPWEREKNSPLAAAAAATYTVMFGVKPQIKVIPAGLECGIIKAIAPKLAVISFGPTLTGAHSPSEKLDLASFARFYCFLHKMVSG